MENKFNELFSLNVNDKVEKKNNLSYLSWSWAWAEFCKVYPNATYKVMKDDKMNCAFGNSEQGYMVYTEVTANGLTHEMWLPVMDFKNKSMLAPTTFDINKAVMRCLTKNLAMFGLGLYIYSGEDLPEDIETEEEKNKKEEKRKKDEIAKKGKVVHDIQVLLGDDIEKFNAAINTLNKKSNTDHKGLNDFDLNLLEAYLKHLESKKQ